MTNSEDEIRILNHDGKIITTKLKNEVKTLDPGCCVITTKLKAEITVDLSTSCNKAVAVAKLLGWMKGPSFPQVMVAIQSDDGDTYYDLFRMLDEDENFLQEMLPHMRKVASQELAAAEADATPEELKKKKEAVASIDSVIDKAFKYLSDINEELSKDEDSEIKVDQKISEEKGITRITQRSVDQWAKKKYGISILDDQKQSIASESAQMQPTVREIEENLDTKDGLSKTYANNLFITLAFLVEALAEIAPKKYGEDKPNVIAISKRIYELAAKANDGNKMDAQGVEAIKKRIVKAMEVKKSKPL